MLIKESYATMLESKEIFKVDVFSYAMTIYEIASGERPWGDIKESGNIVELVLNGKRPAISNDIPERLSELIQSCWYQTPSDRPSFNEIFDILTMSSK